MREATTQAVLSAAEATLAEEGYQAAKMETIAARAGVAVGTVYNYFPDRDHLLSALLTARRADVVAAIDTALEAHKGEPWRAQLEAFVSALLTHIEAHRAFFRIIFQGEWLSQRAGGPGKCEHPRTTLKDIYARIEKLARAGVRAGTLRAEDEDLYPALLLGMARGLIVRELYQTSPRALTELAEPLIRIFLRGAAERSR